LEDRNGRNFQTITMQRLHKIGRRQADSQARSVLIESPLMMRWWQSQRRGKRRGLNQFLRKNRTPQNNHNIEKL
jgi:hypothetical protein